MGLYCTCPYGSTAELSKDVMSNLQWHFINPYWYHQLNHSQALTDEQKFTKNLRITPPETDLSILQLVGQGKNPPKTLAAWLFTASPGQCAIYSDAIFTREQLTALQCHSSSALLERHLEFEGKQMVLGKCYLKCLVCVLYIAGFL